ncbi:MAG TPA: hypothetical protein VGM76_00885 [Lacipirellulaceae bacterium]
MNHDPIDISLDQTGLAKPDKQSRSRPAAGPYFARRGTPTAPPEAFDEIFTKLALSSASLPNVSAPTKRAKLSLDATPLLALSASLEQQHQRLAALLREIETGA